MPTHKITLFIVLYVLTETLRKSKGTEWSLSLGYLAKSLWIRNVDTCLLFITTITINTVLLSAN